MSSSSVTIRSFSFSTNKFPLRLRGFAFVTENIPPEHRSWILVQGLCFLASDPRVIVCLVFGGILSIPILIAVLLLGFLVGTKEVLQLSPTSSDSQQKRKVDHSIRHPNKQIESSLKVLQYKPLDTEHQEIRLIKCLRYTGATVSLEMFPVPLGDAPPYLALLYAWGDPSRSYHVISDEQIIRVTPNLLDALVTVILAVRANGSAIYEHNEDIYFWAYGIHINQDDFRQKQYQVPLMKEIYTRARGVTAYLGRLEDPFRWRSPRATLDEFARNPTSSKYSDTPGQI
jgi:hypothetical protein